MVLTLEIDSVPIMEMLWLREAWGLHPTGDLPPGLTDPPEDVRTSPDADQWERAWPVIWASVVLHAGQQPDRGLINALVTTPKGELGRDDVLARLRGPSWRDRYGDAAFDDRYDEWCARRIEWRNGVGNAMLLDRGGHPPLDALVTAWEAGLTRVVTIPCVGSYIRANSVCSLLITEETRADPEAYSAALTWFAEQAGHAD